MRFPPDFVTFIELLTEYDFPGDVYNVATEEPSSGNDSISDVYDLESRSPTWPAWLIPFYGIGNGDYFGLDARQGASSAVHYWYHERGSAETYSGSFDEWLRTLPKLVSP